MKDWDLGNTSIGRYNLMKIRKKWTNTSLSLNSDYFDVNSIKTNSQFIKILTNVFWIESINKEVIKKIKRKEFLSLLSYLKLVTPKNLVIVKKILFGKWIILNMWLNKMRSDLVNELKNLSKPKNKTVNIIKFPKFKYDLLDFILWNKEFIESEYYWFESKINDLIKRWFYNKKVTDMKNILT